MGATRPIHLGSRDGERLWYDGGLITFKASGAQTGGAFLLFEALMPRGKATPLHVHPDADETLYVLDGEILLHVGGAARPAGTGTVATVPRGTPHAFLVRSETTRLLVLCTPAGTTEAFFREAGDPAGAPTLSPTDADPARSMAAARRAGLVILGPPPFAPADAPGDGG